jgi:hypothetical protein
MLAVEAVEARVLEDIRANPLDIVSFPYIIDFDLSILFSLVIINRNPKKGIRHS